MVNRFTLSGAKETKPDGVRRDIPLRDLGPISAPTAYLNYARTLPLTHRPKLALQQAHQLLIMSRKHHLPLASNSSEQVREPEQIHVVKALQRVVEGGELQWEASNAQVEGKECHYR